jgi:predicted nucleic acid-binding protein
MAEGGEGGKVRLVIDASVAAKWIIPGEPWDEKARALKEAIAKGNVEAYAPVLILYELTSVIFKAVRNGVLSQQDGVDGLREIGLLGVKLIQVSWENAGEMLEIAIRSGLTIYDSAYLLVSKRVGGTLVTADVKLRDRGRAVTEVAALGDIELPIGRR